MIIKKHPVIGRFFMYPAPAARISGCFAPSFEAKSASESGLHRPAILNEPLSLLVINDL